MTKHDYSHLQNGSDIRGIALPGVEGQEPDLTPAEAENTGYGFVIWLSKKLKKDPKELKIAIGRDPRKSGPDLARAFIKGASAAGACPKDCGLATTPAMFMTTIFREYSCDGSVMVTASHLPWNRNGLKFFDKNGGLQKEDISEILKLAADAADSSAAQGSEKSEDDSKTEKNDSELMDIYSAHLRSIILEKLGASEGEQPLSGLKIAVDAGNGSGGFYPEEVLAPLGADVSASRYLEPDGSFPNHIPNPENNEAIADLSSQVKKEKCDFGIIFDTDVDRSSAVDRYGHPINHDSIVALAAALVADEHPGTTVVTDSITSTHLTDFLENTLGLSHFRYKRGYKNVINKAIELNDEGIDCQLAIETSGHAAMKENYFLDDGAYLATRIVIKAAQLAREGKTIDGLLSALKMPKESREVRMKIKCPEYKEFGDALLSEFAAWAEKEDLEVVSPNYEGVRISFPKGWCLLRKSLHEPLMPLNIQSDKPGGVKEISKTLKEFLARYDDLDSSEL